MLQFHISALKCYQGSGDSAVLSNCTGSPAPDRCIKETISGVVSYACDLASNKIIEGSVADSACSTIDSDKICICRTDGCNDPSATALSCYQGYGDSAVLSSCTVYPASDRCAKTTTSGVVLYHCSFASMASDGSITDNACSTINSVEICLCDTDGCNNVSSSSSSSRSSSMT